MDFFLETNNLMLVGTAVLSGIMLLWPTIQRKRAGSVVGTTAAVQMINQQNAMVIDVRPLATYQNGHIPQSRSIPLADLEKKAANLPKDKPIILACDRGQIAVGAAAKLRQAGFTNVSVLDGGLNAWITAGLPTSTKR